MKAIIYAGIGLFSVATVYGVTDFYQTQKNGTLSNLYKEEEEEPIVKELTPLSEKDITVSIVEEPATELKSTTTQKTIKKKIKKEKTERTIRLEEYSRGKIEEPMLLEKFEPVSIEDRSTDLAEPQIISTKNNLEKVTKRRKIDLGKFSRAPLRVKKTISPKEAELYKM